MRLKNYLLMALAVIMLPAAAATAEAHWFAFRDRTVTRTYPNGDSVTRDYSGPRVRAFGVVVTTTASGNGCQGGGSFQNSGCQGSFGSGAGCQGSFGSGAGCQGGFGGHRAFTAGCQGGSGGTQAK